MSYLKSNNTLASLHLLIIKTPFLLICIFHSNVNLCIKTFSFCLEKDKIIYDCMLDKLQHKLIHKK